MNAQSLLDQLLSAGQSVLSNTPGNPAPGKPGYANFGTGMLAGGVLGLLLGDKRVRKFGGKALTYGGAAALGALAFRAYSNWQQQKSASGCSRCDPAPSCTVPSGAGLRGSQPRGAEGTDRRRQIGRPHRCARTRHDRTETFRAGR